MREGVVPASKQLHETLREPNDVICCPYHPLVLSANHPDQSNHSTLDHFPERGYCPLMYKLQWNLSLSLNSDPW